MGTQGSPVKSYDYLLKFLLVGDSDVGKGEILESLQDGAAESPYAYSNGKEAPPLACPRGAAPGPLPAELALLGPVLLGGGVDATQSPRQLAGRGADWICHLLSRRVCNENCASQPFALPGLDRLQLGGRDQRALPFFISSRWLKPDPAWQGAGLWQFAVCFLSHHFQL